MTPFDFPDVPQWLWGLAFLIGSATAVFTGHRGLTKGASSPPPFEKPPPVAILLDSGAVERMTASYEALNVSLMTLVRALEKSGEEGREAAKLTLAALGRIGVALEAVEEELTRHHQEIRQHGEKLLSRRS